MVERERWKSYDGFQDEITREIDRFDGPNGLALITRRDLAR